MRAFFGLGKRPKSPTGKAVFVFILVMYHSRQTDFTVSAADDLMDFLAGGFSPSCSTCLVMPAPLANERKKAND